MFKKIFIFYIMIFALSVYMVNAQDVSVCGVLNESGTFNLINDLDGGGNNFCLIINSSNVVLDCNGYTIENTVASAITNGLDSNGEFINDNVVIRNCVIDNTNYGNIFVGIDMFAGYSSAYFGGRQNISNWIIENSVFKNIPTAIELLPNTIINLTISNVSIYSDTQQSIGVYIVSVDDNMGSSPLSCDGIYLYNISFFGVVPYEIFTLATDYSYLVNCSNVVVDSLYIDDSVANITTLYGLSFFHMINPKIYNSHIGNYDVGTEQVFECNTCSDIYFENNVFDINGTWNFANSNVDVSSYNNTGYFPNSSTDSSNVVYYGGCDSSVYKFFYGNNGDEVCPFIPEPEPETVEQEVSKVNNALVNMIVIFIIIGVILALSTGFLYTSGFVENEWLLKFVGVALIGITIIILVLCFSLL